MTNLRIFTQATAIALLMSTSTLAQAWGSYGGSHGSSGGWSSHGSSGGSSGSSWASHGSSGGWSGGSAGSRGSSGGYYTSYGSSGGSSGGSAGQRRGGFLSRLFGRHHRRTSYYASSGGSSGGSWSGSHGSSGGYYTSHGSSGGSSGGSWGSHGSSGGSSGGAVYSSPAESYSVPLQSQPGGMDGYVVPPTSDGQQDAGGQETDTVQSVEDDAALLTVAVPQAGASVTVNGKSTRSTGETRRFMSRGLQEGFVYTYVVRAQYEVDGELQEQTRSVKLRGGESERIEFDASPANDSRNVVEAEPTPETVVTLHVPADAAVTLAGNRIEGDGEVRTFRTNQLKEGERWDGYEIRVTANVDGQPVSQQRNVTVEAGSKTELTFDFEENAIAQR